MLRDGIDVRHVRLELPLEGGRVPLIGNVERVTGALASVEEVKQRAPRDVLEEVDQNAIPLMPSSP